jgi:hypothetical protein
MAEQKVKNSASPVADESQSKKDKDKKKKKDKRKHQSIDEGEEEAASNMEDYFDTPSKKDKKRKKKDKRTTEAKEESDGDSDAEVDKNDTAGSEDKKAIREARKLERLARRKEKEELIDKVPMVDGDGIAYTKLQIKRMLKRVKRGLPPVATEHEENERRRNDAQLRREEEDELAGMVFRREADDDDDSAEDEPAGDEAEQDEEDKQPEQDEEDKRPADESKYDNKATHTKEAQQPQKKKSKRSKPVPPDYVCSACKNKHTPVHWIYDCPEKVTVKGTNNKRKKDRGVNQPDSRKVYVSGLPFQVKPADVEQLFQDCGKMVSCKLLKFDDTGRCNGQAYVSFETDEAATKALKLSGTTIDNTQEEKSNKKKKKTDAPPPKRRELKLKISRVLNRRLTKRGHK